MNILTLKPILEAQGERLFSYYPVTKINRKNRKDQRVLALTSLALYNIKGSDHCSIQRKIPLSLISGVILNDGNQQEFIVKVPSEYDYRFLSSTREAIIQDLRHLKSGNALNPAEFSTWVAQSKEFPALCRHRFIGGEQVLPANAHVSRPCRIFLGQSDGSVSYLLPKEKFTAVTPVEVLGRNAHCETKLVEYNGARFVEAKYEINKEVNSSCFRRLTHPGLVGIEQITWGSGVTVYTEHCANGDLGRLLGLHPDGLHPFVARLIAVEIAEALRFLHERGIAFHTLRPSKVVFTAECEAKLLYPGFNLAQLLPLDEIQSAHSEYQCPDDDSPISNDWWSFGVLLHEMTLGAVPLPTLESHVPAKVLGRDFQAGEAGELIARMLSPVRHNAMRGMKDEAIMQTQYLKMPAEERRKVRGLLHSAITVSYPVAHFQLLSTLQFRQ